MPEHEITHLVTFRLQGPEFLDERGLSRRETLVDVEVRLNEMHGGNVASMVLEMLSRRGAILFSVPPVVPLTTEEQADLVRQFEEQQKE